MRRHDLTGTGVWAFAPPPVVDLRWLVSVSCGRSALQYGLAVPRRCGRHCTFGDCPTCVVERVHSL